MTRPLIILGAGGSTSDLLDLVVAINARAPTWQPIGFLDDARPAGDLHLGLPLLGPLRNADQFPHAWFVNVIAGDRNFRQLPTSLASTGLPPERFATLVHPAAVVSSRARLGQGVVINPGAVLAGAVEIGNHVMICPGVVLGHEARVGDHCILAPGAILSGLTQVEPGCYIGTRAVIRQNLTIGAGALIGMGAVVVANVQPGTSMVGVPARPVLA